MHYKSQLDAKKHRENTKVAALHPPRTYTVMIHVRLEALLDKKCAKLRIGEVSEV